MRFYIIMMKIATKNVTKISQTTINLFLICSRISFSSSMAFLISKIGYFTNTKYVITIKYDLLYMDMDILASCFYNGRRASAGDRFTKCITTDIGVMFLYGFNDCSSSCTRAACTNQMAAICLQGLSIDTFCRQQCRVRNFKMKSLCI